MGGDIILFWIIFESTKLGQKFVSTFLIQNYRLTKPAGKILVQVASASLQVSLSSKSKDGRELLGVGYDLVCGVSGKHHGTG